MHSSVVNLTLQLIFNDSKPALREQIYSCRDCSLSNTENLSTRAFHVPYKYFFSIILHFWNYILED